MMRLASSLAVGDTVGPRDAVVVAIEPLNETNTLRITLFVDGGIVQQDAHTDDAFDNVHSPPALLDALQALSDLYEVVGDIRRNQSTPCAMTKAERLAVDTLAAARRLGVMVRYGGVYSVRK